MNRKLKFILPAIAMGILTLAACTASLSEEDGDEATPRPAAPAAFGIEADPTRIPEGSATPSAQATGATEEFTSNGAVEIDVDYEAALQEARLNTRGWDTDFSLHTIPFDDITQVLPRDGIRAIDGPKFITPEEAEAWLGEKEPVIVLKINGEAKAYPIQILIFHEIVNDVIGGVPVAATFCPLCNSAIVFDRRFNDNVHSFGVSGNLRNSDLIMYDRETHTWWQQFTGEGIVGTFAGERLDVIPAAIISFEDFRTANPEGTVLSRDTGFNRSYGQNPYAGYDRADRPPFLFDGDTDGRLLPKDRVVAVSIDDADVAFPLTILEEEGVINYDVNGQDLAIFFTSGTTSALDRSSIKLSRDVGATGVFDPNLDGQKLTFRADGDNIMDNETDSVWNILGQAIEGPLAGKELTRIAHGDHFWFAWAAFKPDTIIYQGAG